MRELIPIFNPPNKYNYRVNILHPQIKPLYERYKMSIGESQYPISDVQRWEFEQIYIDAWLKKHPQYMNIVSKAISEKLDIPEYIDNHGQ